MVTVGLSRHSLEQQPPDSNTDHFAENLAFGIYTSHPIIETLSLTRQPKSDEPYEPEEIRFVRRGQNVPKAKFREFEETAQVPTISITGSSHKGGD